MEEGYDEDLLNNVEAADIIAQSKMKERPAPTHARTFDAAVKSDQAFNNPGATTSVTTSITDGADISMRAHPSMNGGMVTLTMSDGSIIRGPKYEPGEKRKRKNMGLTGEKILAVKLKLDECVLERANFEARDKKVSIFVVNDFCGLAFKVEKGPLGDQVLYVLDGDVYDGYAEQGIATMLRMEITPDSKGSGWVLGGETIQLSFVSDFVNSILSRVARNQIT